MKKTLLVIGVVLFLFCNTKTFAQPNSQLIPDEIIQQMQLPPHLTFDKVTGQMKKKKIRKSGQFHLLEAIHSIKWDNATGAWFTDGKVITSDYNDTTGVMYEQEIYPLNTTTGTFDLTRKTNYYYDNNGYLSASITYELNNSVWDTASYTFYQHNADGFQTYMEIQNYDFTQNQWQKNYKHIFTYNTQNQFITQKVWYSDWSNNTWYLEKDIVNTYDSNDLIVSVEGGEGWDLANNTWHLYKRDSFFYDNNNGLTSAIQYKLDGNWIFNSSNVYTLDANNNIVTDIFEQRNLVTQTVEKVYKWEYIYDNNDNRLEHLRKVWEAGQWVDNSKTTYTYNAQNDMTNWNSYFIQGGNWVLGTKQDRVFDPSHHKITERKLYTTSFNTVPLRGLNGTLYFYSWLTVSNHNTDKEVSIKVFPNPATDYIQVDLPSNFEEGQAMIFDIKGQMVANQNIQSSNSLISMKALPSGAYVLLVRNDEASYTSQIIKK